VLTTAEEKTEEEEVEEEEDEGRRTIVEYANFLPGPTTDDIRPLLSSLVNYIHPIKYLVVH
jgi:hypothetical protein